MLASVKHTFLYNCNWYVYLLAKISYLIKILLKYLQKNINKL